MGGQEKTYDRLGKKIIGQEKKCRAAREKISGRSLKSVWRPGKNWLDGQKKNLGTARKKTKRP